jgi:two-component system NtrC family sensor kinase
VNNFSEVNIELINEMQTELISGEKEDVIDILEDIKQNLEKIGHHGRRADGIVKGMLQHSRASSNTKELTDINKLADEYFRLAYHGLRAKDKSFNSDLVTHFEPNLPTINVVPQDIGRVLLNLFTNAFYAVQQKQKTGSPNYKPAVELTTASILPRKGPVKEIIIKVADNGSGIPEAIKDKIMQPFFTTKPTGEGTGLGLSMSYDIVVKGHGGAIVLDTKEGVFTEFTITLPVN